LPTQRERSLQIHVSAHDDGSPPLPIERLNRALLAWDGNVPLLSESESRNGEREWSLFADGPYAAGEIRRLARLLQKAMAPDEAHVLILLEEPRFGGEERVLRAEICGNEPIEFESGPE
jgi:hypothetical protein